MADSPDGLLRSYVDRVLNVLAEIDDLGDDKKAIYKELADDGFDRSVVSQLVGHLRKKAKKPGKFAEQSALFDLYLMAYEGRVDGGDEDEGETGTVIARAHAAREQADEDGVLEHITQSNLQEMHIAPKSAPPSNGADAQPMAVPAGEDVPSVSPAPLSNVSHNATVAEAAGVTAPASASSSLGSAAGQSESGGISPALSAPTDPEALYAKAVELVLQEGRASPSMLQRRLVVGFNRASDLVERMEREGVVARSPAGFLDVVNHDGPTFQPEASVH